MSVTPASAEPHRCSSRQFNKAEGCAPLIIAELSETFRRYLLTEYGGKNFPLKAAAQALGHCCSENARFQLEVTFSIFSRIGAFAVKGSTWMRFTAVHNVEPFQNAYHSNETTSNNREPRNDHTRARSRAY